MAGDDTTTGMRRRTVLKGAAWSVPIVAVAAGVPAFAASGLCTGYEVSQSIVRKQGAWQYTDTVTVTKDGVPVPVDGITATVIFDPPVPGLGATENHNCTVVVVSDSEVIFTGTSTDTSMSCTLQLGSGSTGPDRVTGTISIRVPGCPNIVDVTPFDVPVIKETEAPA